MSQSGKKSGLGSLGKERLSDIKQREQLKGMLVNKFKLKYGNKPALSRYIDAEVNRFMANNRLSQSNLQMLDERIGKEVYGKVRKEEILADHQSQRSGSVKAPSVHSRAARPANAGNAANDDLKSYRSQSSRASSQPHGVRGRFGNGKKAEDQLTHTSVAETERYNEF